jgi:hypothetical protein
VTGTSGVTGLSNCHSDLKNGTYCAFRVHRSYSGTTNSTRKLTSKGIGLLEQHYRSQKGQLLAIKHHPEGISDTLLYEACSVFLTVAEKL